MLTDERISELFNEWFRREKGGDTYAECWNACARAIEAEVRAEVQEPTLTLDGQSLPEFVAFCLYDFQQATGCDTAEQYLAEKEAQEPAAFPIPPEGIIAHPNLGELYDRLQMQQYAMRYAMLYTTPQQPAPCPAPLDESRYCPDCEALQAKIDLLIIERDAQAVLISDQQADVEKQTEISNNFAAQVRQQNDIIAQQAERIAEIEKVAKAYEDQVAAHNKTLDELKYTGLAAAVEANRGDELQSQVTEQAALIEKCEKALLEGTADDFEIAEWLSDAIAAQKVGAA